MTCYLTRINAERNERRYYLIRVGLSLLGEHCVMREWGRIGGHSQRMEPTVFPTADAAHQVAERLVRRKLKRGYVLS